MKPKAADKAAGAKASGSKTAASKAAASKAADKQAALKAEALGDALAAIHKNHGDGSIKRMGDKQVVPIEGISTGSLGIDLCTGGAGFPRGRVIEIYGPESSGKTTLTLHVVANAQRDGGTCAFIDAEHALDPSYARRLGVDIDSLLISQPDHGEQALDICETLAKSGAVDLIVIDSGAALVPKAEIEGEMGDSFVGLQARLMSQALQKIIKDIGEPMADLEMNQMLDSMVYSSDGRIDIDAILDIIFNV